MQYNIPQFIDMEDHIVGPLTAKQLGWLALGGVILLVLWNVLDMVAFFIAGIFVAALFVSLAFLRPNGQPLVNFVMSSVGFLFKPKMYFWKKVPGKIKIIKISKKPTAPLVARKILNREQVEKLSEVLDKD